MLERIKLFFNHDYNVVNDEDNDDYGYNDTNFANDVITNDTNQDGDYNKKQ